MNLLKLLSPLAVASAFTIVNASATVLWQSDFSDLDAFTPNQTLYNQGDWKYRSIESGNNTDAIIESYQGKNVLRLTSSVPPPASGGYTNIRASFTPIADPVVKVSFGIGWDKKYNSGSTGSGVYLGYFDYNIPLNVGLGGTDGIYASGLDGRVVLLSKDLVRTDFLYQFDLTINYDAKTYDVRLLGLDINGEEVDVTESGIKFRAGSGADFNALRGIYVANYNGAQANMYIDAFTVSQIPETGTTASLASGGLLLLSITYRRYRKSLATQV